MVERRLQTVLVVGPRNAGKSTYAGTVVARAAARGLRVAGFISEGERRPDGSKAYWLRDLADPGWRVPLASPSPAPGLDLRIGRYHLSTRAFEAAAARLLSRPRSDLVCIDEFGPLELGGSGFRPLCEMLWREFDGTLLITVRPALVEPLLHLLRRPADARTAGARRGPLFPTSEW